MYRVASAAANTDTGLNLSASYTYTDDLLTKIQTPSTAYSFTYGNFALRTNVKAGDRTLATYSYADITKLLTELNYGNGDKVNYTYDTKGRLLTQTYEDGDRVTYKYDNNGALATVTDSATGITTTYYYDFTNRMVRYVESGTNYSHTVGYEYDNINNLTTQVETINGVDRSTSYTYDDDNRVKTKQTGSTKVTYTYDGFGRVSQQVTTSGSTTVLTESFTYNGNSSQVATYATTAGGTTKTYSYTYDDNGNILTINDGSSTVTYTYDSANQLIQEETSASSDVNYWSYDNAGNMLHWEYIHVGETDDDTMLIHENVYTYSDGEWGDLLTNCNGAEFTYDGIGNTVETSGSTSGDWHYEWEHGRQLASMTNFNGMPEEYWTTWEFAYNSDGIRTMRTNGTTTYNYIYNGSQLTCMTVDGHTMYFSYDAAGTPLSITFDGTEYFYLTNLQGDVTGIVDATGQSVATYCYDAWGNYPDAFTFAYNPVSTYNPLRYRGYVYDRETGLYYLQSRYYNPKLCRFINGDGLIATGQGFIGNNIFVYCNNNPIMHSDPSGYLILPLIPIWIPDSLTEQKNTDYEYIENQNDADVANVRFGVSTVGHAGCAAVAVYNAMIMLGNGKSFISVLLFFNLNILRLNAGGLLGTPTSLVEDYFLDAGFRVVTTSSKKFIDQHSQTADACILYYEYNDNSFPYIGAHYVSYYNPLPTNTKRFVVYNKDGRKGTISKPSDFAYEDGNYNVLGIFIYK